MCPSIDAHPDTEHMAQLLKTLSSQTRLNLLHELRSPKRPGEVRVPAERTREGFRSDRILSRPAVVQHLQKLEALDLVEQTEEEGPYVVNQQMVFAIIQEFGQLARLSPEVEVDVEETIESDWLETSPDPEGPRLVLVGGPREGHTFPLEGEGPWLIGRGNEADVRLAYDPHVSQAHARVVRNEDGSYEIEAEPDTTNPPRLNFEPLEPGSPVELLAGSVLAVGASRLVLQIL